MVCSLYGLNCQRFAKDCVMARSFMVNDKGLEKCAKIKSSVKLSSFISIYLLPSINEHHHNSMAEKLDGRVSL